MTDTNEWNIIPWRFDSARRWPHAVHIWAIGSVVPVKRINQNSGEENKSDKSIQKFPSALGLDFNER